MKTFEVLYYKNPTGKKKEQSHQDTETWEYIDYYCPNCGKQTVWFRNDGGDYYIGEEFICLSCSHNFYLPTGTNDASKNEQGKQRLKYLKN